MKFDLAKHELQKKQLWQQIKAHGEFFRNGKREGFLYCGKFYVSHYWTEWERGEHYQPRKCDCIPWEVCEHST